LLSLSRAFVTIADACAVYDAAALSRTVRSGRFQHLREFLLQER
jgi:hypothetical protein